MNRLAPKGFVDGPDQAGLLCLIGNHELANFSRAELRSGLHPRGHFVGANGSFYYRLAPEAVEAAGWRFLVLDAFEVSVQSEGTRVIMFLVVMVIVLLLLVHVHYI